MAADPRVQQLIEKLAMREKQLVEAQATIQEFNKRFCEEVEKVGQEYAAQIQTLQTALNEANRQLRAYRQRDEETSQILEAHFTTLELPAPKDQPGP